jgi:exonuclease VII small subunit
MLRAKIDDIFERYRDFITEQIQSQFENETLRYEQIVQHLDEADIALYNQLIQYLDEHLITTFDDYLNGMINYLESALPDMTQQILGAFESTNQTLSSILQSMNSEEKQAVDDTITSFIS